MVYASRFRAAFHRSLQIPAVRAAKRGPVWGGTLRKTFPPAVFHGLTNPAACRMIVFVTKL